MTDQPLRPFSPPTQLFEHLPGGALSAGVLMQWFLYAVFALWALYTIVAIYHWLRYSHAAKISIPAIGIHLLVSAALMSYALSGHPYFLTFLP